MIVLLNRVLDIIIEHAWVALPFIVILTGITFEGTAMVIRAWRRK